MTAGQYLAGVAWAVAIFAGSIGAGLTLVARRRPDLDGTDRALAVSILATAALIASMLVPGILTILTPATASVVALALFAVAWRLPRRAVQPAAGEIHASAESDARLERWLAIAAAAAMGIAILGYLLTAIGTPITEHDYAGFRMPNIGKWIQSGSFWRFDQFIPRLNTGSYPQNGDAVMLAGTLPWRNDVFTRLVNYPYGLLAAVAAYAVGVELGARRNLAALFAAAYLAIPALANSAFQFGLPDAILAAMFGAGVLFLLRWRRTGEPGDLILAGLGLGIALGAKWYGLTGVPIVLVAWALWTRADGIRWARIGRAAAVLVGLIVVAGGFWFVRNWVEVGNPFFPAKVAAFGVTIFDAPHDSYREILGPAITNYLSDGGAWVHHILPGLWQGLGISGALFLIGMLGALVRAVRRRPAERHVVGWLAVAALAMLAVYAITPESAPGKHHIPSFVVVNTRWVIHALLIGAALSAWLATRAGRVARIALAVAALLAALQGASRLSPSSNRVLVAAALIAAAIWVVGALRSGRWRIPGSPAVRVAGAIALTAFAVFAGWRVQDRFNQDRYQGSDAVLDTVIAAPPPVHVGLTGSWVASGLEPAWPSFGKRLQNSVDYVGPTVRGQLVDYQSRSAWTRAVREGGYDLLIVGRAQPLVGHSDPVRWAREDGYRLLEQSDRFQLYAPGGSQS